MANEREDRQGSGTPSEGPSNPNSQTGSNLPRPLQEHLAQQLRSTYQVTAEKPAFLGDPAIPAEFEQHLQRLEAVERGRRREKVRNEGIEAVKTALEDIAGPLEAEPSGSAEISLGDKT